MLRIDKSGSQRNESDVYDRQIRLWGAEAQSKISSSTVLYVHITGLSSEVLKNLVLAGVKAAICDGRKYPDAVLDMPSSFLDPKDRQCAVGDGEQNESDTVRPPKKQRLSSEEREKSSEVREKKSTLQGISVAQAMKDPVHELNPLLDAPLIEERSLEDIPDSFFEQFEIVIASQISMKDAKRIASLAVSAGHHFILADCFGLYGCAVLDFGSNHTYRRETGKDKWSDPICTKSYLPFEKIVSVPLSKVSDRWTKRCPKEWAMYRAMLEYQNETGRFAAKNVEEDFIKRIKIWLKGIEQIQTDTIDDQSMLLSDSELEVLARCSSCELSPVCAILGGVIGNEVVKVLSGKGEPANNLILFNGMDLGCRCFLVKENSS